MDEPRTYALIELHEGRRTRAYQDTLGNWTIGVGHYIRPADVPLCLGTTLKNHEIDEMFAVDVAYAHNSLVRAFPWVLGLSDVRLAVLTDMCFNLGITRLSRFFNTLKAIETHDYERASRAMLHSKWASQVKTRAITLAHMMRTNEWPPKLS